jgi:hypothetical protein
MNKREHLLAETLACEGGEAFARRAAAGARRRRLAKQAGLVVGVASALTAALILIRPPAAQPTVAVTPAKTAVLEIMSDQELLAQLKDQPVLFLKDQTGITGVVFLADAAPASTGLPPGGL